MDPATGAIFRRDTALVSRGVVPPVDVAFRVRYRLYGDSPTSWRVSPPMFEFDACTVRDTLRTVQGITFHPNFPDGIEPLAGWDAPVCPDEKPASQSPALRAVLAIVAAATAGDADAVLAAYAALTDHLGGLLCSDWDTATASILAEFPKFSIPPHTGRAHAEVLHEGGVK